MENERTKMKITVKPENRSWPRESAKNTKKDAPPPLALFPSVRSVSIRVHLWLRTLGCGFPLCALCVLLRQFDFAVLLKLFGAALLLAWNGGALAAVRYVDVNGANPTPPYTNWVIAAANIQDAVDAA